MNKIGSLLLLNKMFLKIASLGKGSEGSGGFIEERAWGRCWKKNFLVGSYFPPETQQRNEWR